MAEPGRRGVNTGSGDEKLGPLTKANWTKVIFAQSSLVLFRLQGTARLYRQGRLVDFIRTMIHHAGVPHADLCCRAVFSKL